MIVVIGEQKDNKNSTTNSMQENRIKRVGYIPGSFVQSLDTPWSIKSGTIFVHICANYYRFSKFFYWHTLRAICNKVITLNLTTP